MFLRSHRWVLSPATSLVQYHHEAKLVILNPCPCFFAEETYSQMDSSRVLNWESKAKQTTSRHQQWFSKEGRSMGVAKEIKTVSGAGFCSKWGSWDTYICLHLYIGIRPEVRRKLVKSNTRRKWIHILLRSLLLWIASLVLPVQV